MQKINKLLILFIIILILTTSCSDFDPVNVNTSKKSSSEVNTSKKSSSEESSSEIGVYNPIKEMYDPNYINLGPRYFS